MYNRCGQSLKKYILPVNFETFYKNINNSMQTPTCTKNNICYSICSSKSCTNIPFMCKEQNCVCEQIHEKCVSNTKWKIFRQRFEKKLQTPTSQINNYFQQVYQIYEQINNKISVRKNSVNYVYSTLGLNSSQKQLYTNLKSKSYPVITGASINNICNTLEDPALILDIDLFPKRKQQISSLVNKLIELLEDLTYEVQAKKVVENKIPIQQIKMKQLNLNFRFESKITNDFQTISSFFTKKIKTITRLYSASQNQFLISKFWQKCNQKINTLTIIQTQFHKIIGGFTPVAWSLQRSGKSQTDKTFESFLFSLTQKHKIPLIRLSYKTVFHHKEFGPAFGKSDLKIVNKANQYTQNEGCIGEIFGDAQYKQKKQQSYKKFSGQQKGFKFKIKQWEVFQILFQ